jgi:hypothetical protein
MSLLAAVDVAIHAANGFEYFSPFPLVPLFGARLLFPICMRSLICNSKELSAEALFFTILSSSLLHSRVRH